MKQEASAGTVTYVDLGGKVETLTAEVKELQALPRTLSGHFHGPVVNRLAEIVAALVVLEGRLATDLDRETVDVN